MLRKYKNKIFWYAKAYEIFRKQQKIHLLQCSFGNINFNLGFTKYNLTSG